MSYREHTGRRSSGNFVTNLNRKLWSDQNYEID